MLVLVKFDARTTSGIIADIQKNNNQMHDNGGNPDGLARNLVEWLLFEKTRKTPTFD